MEQKQRHIQFYVEDHDLWLRFRKMCLEKGDSITSCMIKMIRASVDEHEGFKKEYLKKIADPQTDLSQPIVVELTRGR